MFSQFSLHDRLLKALDELAFKQPTDVQLQSLPLALEGKDLFVSAETGSGKTAAYLLPILHRLISTPATDTGTRALILVPTRELARQVYKHFKQLASFSSIKAGVIIGGDEFKYQKSLLRKNPEVIIATPGRLVEHMDKSVGVPDFTDLELLVLDEADRMLDMGFSEDVLKIADSCNPKRQSLLFSATLNQRGLSAIRDRMLNKPETVVVNDHREKHDSIEQQIILADDLSHKEKLLAWLLINQSYDKAIVFCNTRIQSNKLGGYIRYRKQRAGVLHGEMAQPERNHVMELFRKGGINILITTDLAARGLDIKGIDLVINFDMARRGDDYIHRIGRTGRAGELGLAISLISTNEYNLMSSIERYLKIRFDRRIIKEEGLQGTYKGPKKLKASGKAAGNKKKKTGDKKAKTKAKSKEKSKPRTKDSPATENSGRRTRTKAAQSKDEQDGFQPLRKKR